MKSQTAFICIFMLSLFALHQCMQMNVREIESSSKLFIPKCVPDICYYPYNKRDCWCCMKDRKICTVKQEDCDSDPNCPPLSLNFLEN
ncbi:EMBRYO SURROUNDING FACTOR 1.2-like [Eutrema salsugineum]|uniref:EMBRYO SURROUNDING FACTOR 1.2-like n=1 Tax=Eutrema salsugineum TaxID=72664 RepID=UPI000CED4B30|nr:EMBRYO SURROUNDING FACTOR 1.2-like [Eutrema salsugineum]